MGCLDVVGVDKVIKVVDNTVDVDFVIFYIFLNERICDHFGNSALISVGTRLACSDVGVQACSYNRHNFTS